MANEKDKYKADVLKIIGLAFMTPFGMLILKILDEAKLCLDVNHIVVLLISILLLYFGIIIVNRGMIHLE